MKNQKRIKVEKNKKIWSLMLGGIIIFGFLILHPASFGKILVYVVNMILLGIEFLIKPINLISLLLISFILTPPFNNLFNHYKKKSNWLDHFEFNWWKKAVLIIIIVLVWILIKVMGMQL